MKASTLIDMANNADPTKAKVSTLGSKAAKKAKVEEKDVTSPKKLAEIVTAMQLQLDELSDALTSSPIASGTLFDNVPCDSGVLLRLRHNFGRRARWSVTNWSGAAAHGFYEDAASDATTLVLVVAVSGYVSLWVT